MDHEQKKMRTPTVYHQIVRLSTTNTQRKLLIILIIKKTVPSQGRDAIQQANTSSPPLKQVMNFIRTTMETLK